jgi:hypothetical protein
VAVVGILVPKLEKGETIHKKYRNPEYTKQKTKLQNKKQT